MPDNNQTVRNRLDHIEESLERTLAMVRERRERVYADFDNYNEAFVSRLGDLLYQVNKLEDRVYSDL